MPDGMELTPKCSLWGVFWVVLVWFGFFVGFFFGGVVFFFLLVPVCLEQS